MCIRIAGSTVLPPLQDLLQGPQEDVDSLHREGEVGTNQEHQREARNYERDDDLATTTTTKNGSLSNEVLSNSLQNFERKKEQGKGKKAKRRNEK